MKGFPSILYNQALAVEFAAKSPFQFRYPPLSVQTEILPLETAKLPRFAYNPSIYRMGDKFWMTYRYHRDNLSTRLGIAEIDDVGQALNTQDLALGPEALSYEDARLFTLQGEPWLSWVEAKWDATTLPTAAVKYGKLERDPAWQNPKKEWKVPRVFHCTAGGNDGQHLQKNWCFFESDENLFLVHRSWPEYCVLHFQGETVLNDYKTPGARWPYGEIRGGNIVPWDGKLLRLFHSSTERGVGAVEKRYYIGACLMDSKPPFAVLAISKKPILYGSELLKYDCFHFKANVVFPCGLALAADGQSLILALGANDAACALAKIKPGQLNL